MRVLVYHNACAFWFTITRTRFWILWAGDFFWIQILGAMFFKFKTNLNHLVTCQPWSYVYGLVFASVIPNLSYGNHEPKLIGCFFQFLKKPVFSHSLQYATHNHFWRNLKHKYGFFCRFQICNFYLKLLIFHIFLQILLSPTSLTRETHC